MRDILILFTISVTFLYKFSLLILKWKIHTHFSPNCPYVLHNLFCVWTKMLSKSLSKCLCRFFFLLFQYVIYATTFSDGLSTQNLRFSFCHGGKLDKAFRPDTKFELHKKEPTKLELQKNELIKFEPHKFELLKNELYYKYKL